MRYLTLAGAGLLAVLFLAACDDAGEEAPPVTPTEPQQSPEPETPPPAD